MFRLRLLSLLARLVGVSLTYAGKVYDGASSRGRTLWETDNLSEAISHFRARHRLNREKTLGTFTLTVEAEVARHDYDGRRSASQDRRQLPLPIREQVQDAAEGQPHVPHPQEAEAAQDQGAGSRRAAARHHAGPTTVTGPTEPVEITHVNLSDLGVRR
jgi:hypothetical protein